MRRPTALPPSVLPRARRAAAIAAIAVLTSCGEDSGPVGPGVDDDGSGVVTAAGGRVSLGSEAGVIVPPGAVAEPVEITIERAATPADLSGAGAVGRAYRFSPSGLQFAIPVEVFVFVPEAVLEGVDVAALALLASEAGPNGSLAPAAARRLADLRHEPGIDGITVYGRTASFSIISAASDPLPLADAGPDRSVTVGSAIEIVGSGSDPAGGPVSFEWSIVSRPAGSSTALAGDGETATLDPDVAGDFVLRLTVVKPSGASAADDVTVRAMAPSADAIPDADAGPDLRGDVGVPITLSGAGSTGAPPLSFRWRFLSIPGGSAPRLSGASSQTATFTPARGGRHAIELTVTNSRGSSADTVAVDVNTPPIAALDAPSGVVTGEAATIIDASSDLDGDPLTLSWTLSPPPGSAPSFSVGADRATLVPDVPGFYGVEVVVHDGRQATSARVEIAAVPDVSGSYASTFVLDAAPACGVEEATVYGPADLPVTQEADRVTLHVGAISDGRASDVTGPIRPDGTFDFSAPMQFRNEEGGTFSATPRWTGRFGPGGELEADFAMSVAFCQITGTLEGTRN